jgi:hypothetical protein
MLLKDNHSLWRLFPSAEVAQAPAYSYLSYTLMQKVWDTTCLALMLLAAVAACVRFEPRPRSPEQITSNFGSPTLDNPKLKEFLETNLNRKFIDWPASSCDFYIPTLAALYYHPKLDVAKAKHISINTK